MLLQGVFPAITTPFYPDGKVYLKKLEHNVERYSRTPVSGMVVLGSTGEAVMLADQERREVLKTAMDSAAPSKVLIAGTGCESAIETLRLGEYVAELGYDVVLVRTPNYYRTQMQPANILAFYRTIADRSALPVLIYNIPQCTGYDIPVEIVVQLAEHPNIIGIKESGGDVEKVRKMVACTRHVKRQATVTETFDAVTSRMIKSAAGNAGGELVAIAATPGATKPSSAAITVTGGIKTRPKEAGFTVLAGSAHQMEASLQAGAAGGILALASPAPTACYEIFTAWKEGDFPLARAKQDAIANASRRIVSELGVPAIKYAMDLNGYYGGPPRLPLLPLTSDLKVEVERLMADIRN
ncbi:MAG: dihydrodipicolinate synthase family protein [Acidobacteriales bacterium]|nr:dihydrodipicolinate synthase family protein [Terriglobales bacterium]